MVRPAKVWRHPTRCSLKAERRQSRLASKPSAFCWLSASGIAPVRVWLTMNVHPTCQNVNTHFVLAGYEHVCSIAAAITGDWDAARDVRLVLPETGVCSSGILVERGVACCAASAALDPTSDAARCPSPASNTSGAGSCCGM